MDVCHGHSFHVPVMGIGYTLDTPLKIARYGLSSCISLVDDTLIEQARESYCRELELPFEPIPRRMADSRAKRITAYLNLLADETSRQFEALRDGPIDDPNGIARYVGLLPEGDPLRDLYRQYRAHSERSEDAQQLAERIRKALRPGAVEANIMTKLDRADDAKGRPRPEGQSDALAALRGFAGSRLEGNLVLSAGVNQRLFALLSQQASFLPDERGRFRQKVVLKVSDFRSASIQSKLLARQGIWVHQFRIESGLNCGGHAFPTDGVLLGPILDDFRRERAALRAERFETYGTALRARGLDVPSEPPAQTVTVQGGIGTHEEDLLLRRHFEVDGTGWGSPMLMVPEVCAVDVATRRQLEMAQPREIALTWGSPLGVRFWSLKTSASNQRRTANMQCGRPGSECPKGHLALNHDFGMPLCPASRTYQEKRLAQLGPTPFGDTVHAQAVARVLAPECICHDLGASFKLVRRIDEHGTPSICPGPNIVNFQRTMTLEQMCDHIYGRASILSRDNRPHQFLAELDLYLDHYARELECTDAMDFKAQTRLNRYASNVENGISFYRELSADISEPERSAFTEGLAERLGRLDALRSRAEGPEPSSVARLSVVSAPVAAQESVTSPNSSTG